jgi:hypothetical protein
MIIDRSICGTLIYLFLIKIKILFLDNMDQDILLSKIMDNILQHGKF